MKKFSTIICSFFLFILINYGDNSFATTIILDFSSLPSDEGWSYASLGNNVAETDIFSIDNGIMNQNTLNVGFSGQGDNRYELTDIIDPHLSYSITVIAKMNQDFGDPNNDFGFGWASFTGSELYGIGLSTDGIMDIHHNIISNSIDTTLYHTYLLYVNPGIGYDLFVDNEFIGSGLPRYYDYNNMLTFGDQTGGRNANVDIDYYEFRQETPVPEPSTILLLSLGLSSIIIARKKISK